MPAADIERLQALDSWTTEAEARPVVQAPNQAADAPATSQEIVVVEQGVQAPQRPAMPWDGLPPGMTRPYHVQLPAELYLKLKWLGDTTYESSMRQIAIEALEAAVNQRIKERLGES